MPALRELPAAIRHVGFVQFWKKVWFEINDDNLFTWASALAYSWLFAVFPFFLVLLSIIPLLKPSWRVEAMQEFNQAINQLPREAKVTVLQYVEPKLRELVLPEKEHSLGISSLMSVGLLVTLWAASGGMAMTMAALDRAYDVPRSRPFYKQRPLAMALTVTVAALILAVVVLIPIGTIVTNYLINRADRLLVQTGIKDHLDSESADMDEVFGFEPPASRPTTPPTTAQVHAMETNQSVPAGPQSQFVVFIVIFQVVRFGLALLFLFWVVALVYHFGPNVKQKFRLLSPGSVFAVASWALLAATFRLYIDKFGKYGQTYGAVGGVIILLFFFYLDALLLLVGAEINAEVDAATREMAHKPDRVPLDVTEETVPGPETP